MTAKPDLAPASLFALLTPCLDDWDSLRQLLPLVDRAASNVDAQLVVLVADDGSISPPPSDLVSPSFEAIQRLDVLTLRRNVGHQRALCIGLTYLVSASSFGECAGILVMDSDGEDAPADVARLIERFRAERGKTAVFASRMRRSEGLTFRVFYALYRSVHRILTGIPVRIGNFSIIPMLMARRLAVVPELWSHFAAAVVHARLPMSTVPTARATRLAGQSRMNFVSLVSHGLSAMAVFSDRIGVRALTASLSLITALAIGLLSVVGIRYLTTLAIPGWATTATGLLAVLLTQGLLLSLIFAFLIHLGRSGGSFLPARDYVWFVERCETLWSADGKL